METDVVTIEAIRTGALLGSDFSHQVDGILVLLLNNIEKLRRLTNMIVTIMMIMKML